jgi:hypothetical protein
MRSTRVLTAVVTAAMLVGVPAVGIAKKTPLPQKKNATYKGLTNEGSVCHVSGVDNKPCPVTVKVSKSGNNARTLISWGAPCTDTSKYLRSDTKFTGLAISKGRVKNNSSYDEQLVAGATSHNTVALHGKFKKAGTKYSVAGDFSIKATVKFADGSTTQCSSSGIKWSAKP